MIRADKPFKFEYYDLGTDVETSDPALALLVAEYSLDKLKVDLTKEVVEQREENKELIKAMSGKIKELKKQIKLSND